MLTLTEFWTNYNVMNDNNVKIDFSRHSLGEELAVLPMSLVAALVDSLPKVSDYKAIAALTRRLELATTLQQKVEVLKTAYMLASLQLILEVEEEKPIPVACS